MRIGRESLGLAVQSILTRWYRPSVDAAGQEKIIAIRNALAAQKITTGLSRHRQLRQTQLSSQQGLSIPEAINELKRLQADSASPTRDLNVVMNVQVRLLKEQSNGVRGVLQLPNPELLLNRDVRLMVFAAAGKEAAEAIRCGAQIVGGDELIAPLIEGKYEVGVAFNRVLATTTMLPTVLKVARFLGPLGMMPNARGGSLVAPSLLGEAIRTTRQTVPFRIERRAGLMNMAIGRVSGEMEELCANVQAVLGHLRALGPAQRRYLHRVYLGMPGFPGILVNSE
jgi:large subunit ribosomal protein L1